MPKNKRLKHARISRLTNVVVTEDDAPPPASLPWRAPGLVGLPVVLELGCGKGEHSLAFAAADPRRLYVGVDTKGHRLCVGAEAALSRGLGNVFFLRARVEALRSYFPAGSIEAIWLTFPDPQLKRRKAHTRLSAPAFLDAYADLLQPGGAVYLKTDSMRLYHYTRQSVDRRGGRVIAATTDLHADAEGVGQAGGATSAYESAALAQGKTIKCLAFVPG